MTHILITGASTGLGLALARLLLATTNYRLILTARASSMGRFSELGITEGPRVWLRELDVTSDEQRRRVVHQANMRWGGVDVLVNNAGVAFRSVVEHVSEEERLEQMGINFRAPMELARCVLPSMREKGAGHILNVSSVGGMMAMPTMAVYSASKFALEGATEALWYEVRPWGINVSLIEPGFIHSSSFENTRYTRGSAASTISVEDPYHEHYVQMAPFIGKMMGLARATPDKVAKTILKTIRRRHPPLRVPATMDAHVFSLLRRFLPRRLYHWLLYRSLPGVKVWGPRRRSIGRTGPAQLAASIPKPE